MVEVESDDEGHMSAERTAELFNRVWDLVRRNPGMNVALDMSTVTSVDNRFLRELTFLRRDLRRKNQRIRLSSLRPECSNLCHAR